MSLGPFLRTCSIVLAALVLCTGMRPLHAQDVDVPPELQLTLLARILTFDRSLVARVGDELVIGVVYQPGYPASRDFQREIEAAARETRPKAGGLPMRVVAVELTRPAQLGDALRAAHVDVALVAPLRAVDVGDVFAAARAAGSGTVGSIGAWVDRACAVGFGVERGRPRIRINLEAARAEGSDFGAELLALAEVVR